MSRQPMTIEDLRDAINRLMEMDIKASDGNPIKIIISEDYERLDELEQYIREYGGNIELIVVGHKNESTYLPEAFPNSHVFTLKNTRIHEPYISDFPKKSHKRPYKYHP